MCLKLKCAVIHAPIARGGVQLSKLYTLSKIIVTFRCVWTLTAFNVILKKNVTRTPKWKQGFFNILHLYPGFISHIITYVNMQARHLLAQARERSCTWSFDKGEGPFWRAAGLKKVAAVFRKRKEERKSNIFSSNYSALKSQVSWERRKNIGSKPHPPHIVPSVGFVQLLCAHLQDLCASPPPSQLGCSRPLGFCLGRLLPGVKQSCTRTC